MALDEVSWGTGTSAQATFRTTGLLTRAVSSEPHPIFQQSEVASTLEEAEQPPGTVLDDRKTQQYGNLFFLLQTEPRHIAALCRLVSLSEIDTLLQTVMFTLYGNQYESREEHLLLTMFQVSSQSRGDEGGML